MTPINTKADSPFAEDIRNQIDRLLDAKPETGEQWAEICRLEAMAEEIEREERRANSQFGVGA